MQPGPERAALRTLGINVDPLLVTGCISEQLHLLLRDLVPVRAAQLLPCETDKIVDPNSRAAHEHRSSGDDARPSTLTIATSDRSRRSASSVSVRWSNVDPNPRDALRCARCSSFARTASAATGTSRPTACSPASARSSARSAPTAPRARSAAGAPTAEAISCHGRSGRPIGSSATPRRRSGSPSLTHLHGGSATVP